MPSPRIEANRANTNGSERMRYNYSITRGCNGFDVLTKVIL
jgi:hypothetical protein